MESASLARKLLPLGIAVLAIDVSPTATSLCTLDDVAYAVERLKEGLPNREPYPCVALWGRSAGAVAAIGYAAKDTPSLAGIVCDSAFSDLATLLQIPEWAASPLASMLCLAKTASSLAEGIGGKTAISDLRIEVHLLEAVKQSYVPAMFMHGTQDTLVPKEHARSLREAYGGEAQLLLFPGEHDDQRTKGAEAKAALFLARAFRLEGPAVVNLEQVTCDLVRDTAALARMEEQAAALLASKDSGDRRHGLLLKAIASCPSYRGSAFAKVMARAGCHSSPSTGERYVRYNILVTLPSADSEVVIAWATEPNPAFPGLSPTDRGFVHFAVISCGCLSLQRMRLYESREAPGGQPEDTPMFGAAAVLLDIKDLWLQESRLKPRLVPYTAKLFLQDSGGVELRVGAACLRWAGAAEARPSFQPLSCGYSIFGAALLTAESKSARIEFVDCKDEICAESGEAADGRGLGMGGMGGMGGVGSEVYFVGTTPPPPEQHVLCTGQKSPGLAAPLEEPEEVEEEQEEEVKTLPQTFAEEFEEAVAKFHRCIPGQLLSLPGEQFSCTSGSLLSGTPSGSFFLSKPMESPDIPADSLAISSMESSKSNEVRCSRVLQRTETPIFGVPESGSLPNLAAPGRRGKRAAAPAPLKNPPRMACWSYSRSSSTLHRSVLASSCGPVCWCQKPTSCRHRRLVRVQKEMHSSLARLARPVCSRRPVLSLSQVALLAHPNKLRLYLPQHPRLPSARE
ncbi:unnamed protein product [Polarella glacialis]|uniref:Uncharacterized protein n=1 Tax=Polarella glacialis TaxID=89957 RepID=A0A813L2T4_POLGL|nr:unnamed protein product [Polarella glacialis]